MEKRVFIENGDLPPSVGEILSQVEEFKNKLQVCVRQGGNNDSLSLLKTYTP